MTALLRSLAIVGGLFVAMAWPASASAEYSSTLRTVNLRAGPGPGYARIVTIPAGVSVWVGFCQPKWCKVTWRNKTGWVAAAYLARGRGSAAPSYDSYYDYEYYHDDWYDDFPYGWPYPYPYRHRHHHHPHCKPGDDCKPPKPWPKPGKPQQFDHQPMNWKDNRPKFDKPLFDGGPKSGAREFRLDNGPDLGNGPGPSDHFVNKPSDFDVDRNRGGDRKRWPD